jgi:hypothetical protein
MEEPWPCPDGLNGEDGCGDEEKGDVGERAGAAMVGEFGWFTVIISIALGLLFWHLRYMLPKMPRPEGGL